MKIIHAADVHLGAKMDKFPKEIADKRKEELRNTFRRMVEYARTNQVRVIILAGDVFDSDTPFKRDKDFFYSVIKKTPEIDFLYLKGNHDVAAAYSDEIIPNLKTFSSQWQSYAYGNVVISGIEISSENSASMYSTLSLNASDVNIVVLHGQAGDASGKDKVNLKKLCNKNIDYLALGHVHRHQNGKLDDRGVYAYSGCLEGRGFDETGKHGFILINIGEEIERAFVPFAERTIIEADVDITDAQDTYNAYLKVKEQINFERKNIYRINLVGETDFDAEILPSDVATYLGSDCLYADVKDKTVKKLDIKSFSGDLSLKGEFVRCAYANPEYSDEEKKKIIAIGLKALGGGNIEI